MTFMIRRQGKGQVIHLAHGLFSGAHKKMSNVFLMSETKTEHLGLKIIGAQVPTQS